VRIVKKVHLSEEARADFEADGSVTLTVRDKTGPEYRQSVYLFPEEASKLFRALDAGWER